MDAALQSLLNATVTVAAFTGRDSYGKPTYNTAGAVSYTVLWIKRMRQLRTVDGKTIVSRSTILFDGNPTIGLEDLITLPDGKTPPIVTVDSYVDESGAPYFTRVLTE